MRFNVVRELDIEMGPPVGSIGVNMEPLESVFSPRPGDLALGDLKKFCQKGSGFKKIFEPLMEERKALVGRGLGVESRVGPLIRSHSCSSRV